MALYGRGARKSRKRFQGTLDLFVSLKMEVTVRPGLWTLEAADVVAARLNIRKDLGRLQRASLLTEIARAFAPEHQRAHLLLQTLVFGLDALDRGELHRASLAYPWLLERAGIAPSAATCGRCLKREPEHVALDPNHGMLLCPSCAGSLPLVPSAVSPAFSKSASSAGWRPTSAGP